MRLDGESALAPTPACTRKPNTVTTNPLTNSLVASVPPSLPHALTRSFSHSLSPSLPLSLTPSLPHSLSPSLTPAPAPACLVFGVEAPACT